MILFGKVNRVRVCGSVFGLHNVRPFMVSLCQVYRWTVAVHLPWVRSGPRPLGR